MTLINLNVVLTAAVNRQLRPFVQKLFRHPKTFQMPFSATDKPEIHQKVLNCAKMNTSNRNGYRVFDGIFRPRLKPQAPPALTSAQFDRALKETYNRIPHATRSIYERIARRNAAKRAFSLHMEKLRHISVFHLFCAMHRRNGVKEAADMRKMAKLYKNVSEKEFAGLRDLRRYIRREGGRFARLEAERYLKRLKRKKKSAKTIVL